MSVYSLLKALTIGAMLVAQAVGAAPIGDAIERSAVSVHAPEKAMLLGAAQAGGRVVAVGERGIVVLSEDGGRTWLQAETPTSVTLTTVRFADPMHGWAVGHGGVVLATQDGGKTWIRQLDGRRVAQIILDAARTAGDANAIRDAERLQADGPDKPLLDLLVIDTKRLLAVGAYGIALGSEDGGKTWSSWTARLPNPKSLHIYTARKRGSRLVLTGEQGLLMMSNDAGGSFNLIATPYKGSFFTAELPDDQTIVLAGLRGTALRSVDGGANWSSLTTPMQVSITGSAMTKEGRVLVANQAGFLMALRGEQFQPIHTAPLPPLNGLLPLSGGGILALTVRGATQLSTGTGTLQ